jgi:hypothetical protein
MFPTILKTPSSPLWTRRRISNAANSRQRDVSIARPGTPIVLKSEFSFDQDPDELVESTVARIQGS